MSQAPRGKHDWIRNHYEKAILLAALAALLISCLLLITQIQANKASTSFSLSRIGWKGSLVSPKDTISFDTVVGNARAAATAALTNRSRTTVSELRVSCVKCGRPIPYNALECPFCLAEQPPIVDITKMDTDEDGIPDKVELAWGLDPQSPLDAAGDLDGDGFTNLEEFNASPRTDPKDSESSPDPIVKLRVAAIRPVPFYLRFVSTSTFADGSIRFQLNLQTRERTYFAKLGQVVLGYKVEKYDPEAKDGETLTMVRQSDNYPVVLVKGRPVTQRELAIAFVFLVDRSRLPIQRLKDVFSLRGVEYKVVDIRRESVIIQRVETGEKVTVPMLSAEERSPAAAPPPAEASGADVFKM